MTIFRSSVARRVLPIATIVPFLAVSSASAVQAAPQDQALRPMTFLDVQLFARPGSWTPSPDKAWMLYTVRATDWEEGEYHSDIHLVSMQQGVSSSRQMTFTPDKDETSPQWARDGSFFVFASNRDAQRDKKQDQLYSDPKTPPTVFTAPRIEDVADRSTWIRLVDANPLVREMALGEETEIEWRSTDGKMAGGILVKPVGYREGTRYPLIVAIHGGPGSADVFETPTPEGVDAPSR